MELIARKLKTIESGNDYIVIFESGDITKPLIFVAEYDAQTLFKSLKKALEER